MALTPLLTPSFLSKYKHIICYPLIAIACGLTMWYASASIKDHYWKGIAAAQTAQIVQLQTKVATSDTVIAKLDTQLTTANAAVVVSRTKAATAQKKVDTIVAKYEPGVNLDSTDPLPALPIIPMTFTNLDDCTKQVAVMQTDIVAMTDEIKDDRGLITNLEADNTLLVQKDAEVVKENTDLKQIETDQNVVIDAKDKQITAEKTKTKIWRNISYGLGIAVAALLL